MSPYPDDPHRHQDPPGGVPPRSDPPRSDPPSDDRPGDHGRGERLEVVITAGTLRGLDALDALDLDRLPDPDPRTEGDQGRPAGTVRALITEDELARLSQLGYAVEVSQRIAIAPLAYDLVFTDADADAWLERRLHGIPRPKAGQ